MDRVTESRHFALAAHGDQLYGDKPYRVHLERVVDTLYRFFKFDVDFLCAGWLHDTLEDTAVTEGDIRVRFGDKVAAMVRAVTLEKGPRDAALKKTYAAIRATPGAAIVKLADRIANLEASLEGRNLHKLAKYKGEHAGFRAAVQSDEGGAKM